MSKHLEVKDFAAFFIGGSANLTANKENINALNVFPVPDGDTGTNMSLTMTSAVKNVPAQTAVQDVVKVLAHGALLGARGNSGVILSQILRGFAQGVDGAEVVTAGTFAVAMQKGVELAYKSVMRPVEGTILTVARKMGEAAEATVAANPDIEVEPLIEAMLAEGHIALANTTNQLAQLKQAGVVDSGASGLIAIFEGGLRALKGEEFEMPLVVAAKVDFTENKPDTDDPNFVNHYCTEFFIHGTGIDVEKYRAHLQDMGESQVIVGNEEVVKTHIHTANPGAVLSYALQYGSLHDLKIDNMKDQHRETIFTDEEKAAEGVTDGAENVADVADDDALKFNLAEALQAADEDIVDRFADMPQDLPVCAVVAVSSGEGLDQIFTEMGVSALVSGGQSMNPSASDILDAVNAAKAEQVIILPNNGNIVMAANQAKELAEKPVVVVPTKHITQGIAALMDFDPEQTAEENAEAMQAAAELVKNAQITYAVRDSSADGQNIHEGDILGICDGKITVVRATVEETVLDLVPTMFDDETSLITLLWGEGVTEEDAEALAGKLADAHPDYEVEVQFGGQAVYYYLLSVE